MLTSVSAVIIAILLAIVVALLRALFVRESGGSGREAIDSSARAFRWTLGVIVTVLVIYVAPDGITMIQ
ncbi:MULTISPECIES: hypothetical protein [Streptomyces]|uniref:hypothetical protein n=1 Tax=Streptomyces TaxID=1883 RepID=UPI0036C18898